LVTELQEAQDGRQLARTVRRVLAPATQPGPHTQREDVMSDCQCRRPEILALLAAMSRDWDTVRIELGLLPEDELTALRHASGRSGRRDRGRAGSAPMPVSPLPIGDASCDGSARPGGRRCAAPDCGRLLTVRRPQQSAPSADQGAEESEGGSLEEVAEAADQELPNGCRRPVAPAIRTDRGRRGYREQERASVGWSSTTVPTAARPVPLLRSHPVRQLAGGGIDRRETAKVNAHEPD
jgi:hypothetical protein